MRKFVIALGALLLLPVLTACGSEVTPSPAVPSPGLGAGAQAPGGGGAFVRPEQEFFLPAGVDTPTPAPTAVGLAIEVTPGSFDGVEITRAQFGDVWPFTIESGLAECRHRNRMPIFRVGKEEYPLTGRRVFALADPYDIWLDDSNNPGQKMSLKPVADVALTQCDPSKVQTEEGPGVGA